MEYTKVLKNIANGVDKYITNDCLKMFNNEYVFESIKVFAKLISKEERVIRGIYIVKAENVIRDYCNSISVDKNKRVNNIKNIITIPMSVNELGNKNKIQNVPGSLFISELLTNSMVIENSPEIFINNFIYIAILENTDENNNVTVQYSLVIREIDSDMEEGIFKIL